MVRFFDFIVDQVYSIAKSFFAFRTIWISIPDSVCRSNSPSPPRGGAELGPACWFMVSRRALAPVAACGEATKPGLAPNGSLNQQSLGSREKPCDLARSIATVTSNRTGQKPHFLLTVKLPSYVK